MINYVKIALVIAAGCWFLVQQAFGQDSPQTPYFPYQTGDFWVNEVYEMDAYKEDERIDVIADSINPEGEMVYTLSSTLSLPNERIYHFKIDSKGNIHSDWWYDKGESVKILDSSIEVGETWIAAKTHTYEIAEIIDKYTVEVFGDSTEVKEVLYAANNDSTGTAQEGYHRMYVWWSEKFGILESTGLELPIYQPRLKGLRLGETIYGDTTANLPPVSIEPEPSGNPIQSFQISNYPNPFNPVTNISYHVHEPGVVRMELYTIQGQLVRELTNEYKMVGTHSIHLDGSDLSSGTYFVRARLGAHTQSQPITLIK